MKIKPCFGIAVLGVLIFSTCKSRASHWRGTITEEDGMIVVKNPKELMYGEEVFSLEEELSIGEGEETEEYMFSQMSDIAVDAEENLYVLDSEQAPIKIIYIKEGENYCFVCTNNMQK